MANDDYIEKTRRGYINRGFGDPTPADIARNFATLHPEARAQILDSWDERSEDGPLTLEQAKGELERKAYTSTLRRTHAALSRQRR